MKNMCMFVLVLCFCIGSVNICRADDISDDFYSRIFDLKLKISSKGLDFVLAKNKKRNQDAMEDLERKYRGSAPLDVKQETYRREDDLKKAESEFKAVEGEIKSVNRHAKLTHFRG